MILSLKFRERCQSVGEFLVGEFDNIVAAIRTVWDVQHNDDGTHKLITSTGSITAAEGGSFGGNLIADSDGTPVEIGNIAGTIAGYLGGAGIDLNAQGGITPSHWVILSENQTGDKALLFQNRAIAASGLYTFRVYIDGGGNYILHAATGTVLKLGQSGNRISAIDATTIHALTYFERLRTTPMGEWISVPFAAGNFTANGAMTWTLTAPDQVTFKYTLIGKTMLLNIYLDSTTVGGVLNTTLSIAIPGGFVATEKVQNITGAFDNGVPTTTFCRVNASGTTVDVNRLDLANFTASVNNTFIRVMMAFEIL